MRTVAFVIGCFCGNTLCLVGVRGGPLRASIIAAVIPAQLAMLDVLFVRYVPLRELALSLGALVASSIVVAYFSRPAVRAFFTFLALGSFLSLLLLSCYTGVGWENPIFTALLDSSFHL